MDAMIRIENVTVSFQRHKRRAESFRTWLAGFMNGRQKVPTAPFFALREVSITVPSGKVLGVIGRNGAGKSTLLRLIGGIYAPDSGHVKVHGKVSTLLSLGAGFQNELDGIDNIFLNGLLMGLTRKTIEARLAQIIEFAELGDFIYEPVKTYSSGMVARLGFAIAAHVPCEVLLVDEILGVGDKEFKKKSKDKIEQLIREDRTVVLVSHSMDDIRRYSHQVLWLDRGSVKAFGTPEDVVSQYLNGA